MSHTARLVYGRATYVALALGTIVLGLTVHSRGDALGATWHDVLGDIIWAAMMTWCVAAIAPSRSLLTRGIAAVAICFAVEASQLYHSPALDTLRGTTVGQLTLGSGFDVRDLFAYVVGVLTAMFLESIGRRSRAYP